MDSEDLFTILAVIVIVVVKVLLGFLMFKREKPPAEPSESMRELLESLNDGESRRVVITRNDGKPVYTDELTPEELLEMLEAPEEAKPAPEPAEFAETEADKTLLAEQLRLEGLAAQAEARLAVTAPSAYDVPEEEPQMRDDYAARLPEFVRKHARDAVALSIVLAPPPGLAK